MRAEIEAAERRSEVRRAARSWEKRGVIEPETLIEIEKAYSDDRSRVGPVFRVLLFGFTLVAVFSAFGLLDLAEVPWGVLLFLLSVVCLMATEHQMNRHKRSSSGAEEATAFLAVVFMLAAAAWVLIDTTSDLPWRLWFFLAAVAWSLAAWRWGSWPYGTFAAVCIFGVSAFLPATRLLWIVTAALIAPLLVSLSLSARPAPSHRRACDAAMLVLLTAVYLTVHVGAYDSRLLEGYSWIRSGGQQFPFPGRWFFIGGTAVMPILLLVAGIRWRLPIFFRTAVMFGVVSLVTLRFYVHVAPFWVVLTVSGVASLSVALILRRYLGSGPGGERHGFTAEPLYESMARTHVLEMGMAAALEPGAAEQPDSPSFRGGGGEFGGGGASDKW